MARPRKDLNWDDIEKLCALQCTQEEIAWFAGISVDTIERHCLDEYGISFAEFFKQKRGVGRISLRRKQWEAAQKGSIPMLIWLGKQYLGQSDKRDDEPTDPSKHLMILNYNLNAEPKKDSTYE